MADIIETIDTALSNILTPLDIESFYGWYDEDINDTHVTFILLSDEDIDYSDDEAEKTEYYVQVDIWSKENVESLKKAIKTAMKGIPGCYYSDGRDFYEVETKIYRKSLRFYIEEDVV